MPDILKDYFEALERLKCGKTINVPKGTKITNDSVSLEAGRKKGTLKKSRPIFSDLISAINAAATVDRKPTDEMRARLEQAKAESDKYRALWEEALAREVSLVKELWDAREAWKKEREAMTNSKVAPIRRPGAGFDGAKRLTDINERSIVYASEYERLSRRNEHVVRCSRAMPMQRVTPPLPMNTKIFVFAHL